MEWTWGGRPEGDHAIQPQVNLPSHEAKPLTLGQEAVSVLFGVLALQLKYKVFEQKDKWTCW